ncbi:flagellar hook-associated protein FlgK [Nocardioides sp.]|uniref:flagellar hook-associated protein FlgK n=1 Tax=Nocardioides sp. TaxID=35761 RepID=UPI0025E15704|nr:flagellar hook-associated protein FlgK [Nocardioides sp.]
MAGSFASINTALTALRYQQTALDIASTNVANVGTDGYVRRRVVGETLGVASAPARWSRSTETSSGVQATRVDRMTDVLLDSRMRREHGRQSYLDGVSGALARIETGLAEPGPSGVAAALADFRGTLADLGNAPGSDAARSQALGAAATLVDAVKLQSAHLGDEAADQRSHLVVVVNEVNAVSKQLAATNRTISAALNGSSDTTSLMDERDALALRLSELTGAKATVQDDGSMSVELNGTALVAGFDAKELVVTGGVDSDGSALPTPIGFAAKDTATGTQVAVAGDLGGDLGATVHVLRDELPAYVAGLAGVVKDLVNAVNDAHRAGYKASGVPGGDLFKFTDPDLSTFDVLITDVKDLAVSKVAGPSNDGNNAAALAQAVKVDDQYQQLVNGFGSKVASAQQLAKNQQALTDQVDSAREQMAGVSLDEETVNMLSAQRAYEAAARVMTTLDSVLDTLINRTGLVR